MPAATGRLRRGIRGGACAIVAATCLLAASCSSQTSGSASSSSGAVAVWSSGASSAPTATSAGTATAGGTIVGTWSTGKTYAGSVHPFVTFAADNTWSASDGCNTVQGTWKESAPGTLAVTSGPHTMMACDGAPLPSAVASARTYTLVDGKLTLYDKAGTELVVLMSQASGLADSAAPSTSG